MTDEPTDQHVPAPYCPECGQSENLEAYVSLLDAEVARFTEAVEYLRSVMYSAADTIDDRSETLGFVALSLRHAAGADFADIEIARRLRKSSVARRLDACEAALGAAIVRIYELEAGQP